MKGLIFINKIKLKLTNFLKYLPTYSKENAVLFLLINIICFISIFRYKSPLEGFVICFMILPIFLVHLILEKNNFDLILPKDEALENNKTSSKKILINFYLINYLKFYTVFLMIFLILYFCSFLSSIMSLFVLFDLEYKSLGQLLILLLSVFILIEGFYTLLSLFPILIHTAKNRFNPFKSIWTGRKQIKKELFPHVLSVCAFSLLMLPLVFMGDITSSQPYISTLFISAYLMIVLNFSIFDMKDRLKNEEEMKSK